MKLLCFCLVQHMLHQIKAQHFYTDLGLRKLGYVLHQKLNFRTFPVLLNADFIFKKVLNI